MKIKISLLLFILFLTACFNIDSNETEKIELEGESESWYVFYNIDQTRTESGVASMYTVELKFKNIDNENIDEVWYEFKSASRSMSGKGTVDGKGLFIMEGSNSLNAAIPNNIDVTLFWNDKSESLTLSRN